jgi:hypothetical protein
VDQDAHLHHTRGVPVLSGAEGLVLHGQVRVAARWHPRQETPGGGEDGAAMSRVAWRHQISEAEHLGYLLRVQATASPLRFRWFVTKQDCLTKAPFNSKLDKASAHGFSSSFERAQIDAVAMADVMHKAEAT